jgi:hypothetical protein
VIVHASAEIIEGQGLKWFYTGEEILEQKSFDHKI